MCFGHAGSPLFRERCAVSEKSAGPNDSSMTRSGMFVKLSLPVMIVVDVPFDPKRFCDPRLLEGLFEKG